MPSIYTIPDIEGLLQPLEEVTCLCFLQTHMGQNSFNSNVCLGDLEVINSVEHAATQHCTSCKVTAPFINLIIEQSKDYPI